MYFCRIISPSVCVKYSDSEAWGIIPHQLIILLQAWFDKVVMWDSSSWLRWSAVYNNFNYNPNAWTHVVCESSLGVLTVRFLWVLRGLCSDGRLGNRSYYSITDALRFIDYIITSHLLWNEIFLTLRCFKRSCGHSDSLLGRHKWDIHNSEIC